MNFIHLLLLFSFHLANASVGETETDIALIDRTKFFTNGRSEILNEDEKEMYNTAIAFISEYIVSWAASPAFSLDTQQSTGLSEA